MAHQGGTLKQLVEKLCENWKINLLKYKCLTKLVIQVVEKYKMIKKK